MKFRDTKFWKEYGKFSKIVNLCSMRSTVDGYVLYKFMHEFQFKNILEIGFFEGQTAGLFSELCDGKVTCVDPCPRLPIFNAVYGAPTNIVVEKLKSINFNFGNEYDLISLDGNTEYIQIDLQNSLKALSINGILLVNQYNNPGVPSAIATLLPPLRPIVKTNQFIAYARPHVNIAEFIDARLPHLARNFINFDNVEVDGTMICNIKTLPIFTDRLDFFDKALEEYNL